MLAPWTSPGSPAIVVEKMNLSGVKYQYTGGMSRAAAGGDVKTMLLSVEALEG